MSSESALHIAEALTVAVATLDAAQVGKLYAKNAIIWHNSDNVIQTVPENLALMTAIFGASSSFRYIDIVREPIADGFLQHHSVEVIFKDGTPAPLLHACMVVRVRDGKIHHLKEWLDAAQWAAMWDRIGVGISS